MPILEFRDFISLKSQSRAILAIDCGSKVFGTAISDPFWSIAIPFQNIVHKKFTSTADEIFRIMEERNVIGLVIGLPLNMDGSEGVKCQSARQFGRNLTKINDVNITFYDERYSTIMAERSLAHSDLSWDKKQDKIDKIAAAFILEGFLDKAEKAVDEQE